jgi:hypothetical protein
VQKQQISLVSEDGTTELLGKGADDYSENALKNVPFELIGYITT